MVWQKDDKSAYEVFIKKYNIVFLFFLFLFICLSLRLFYLQIIVGSKYRKISEQQRLYNTCERAPRGIIYSADNVVLVENRLDYTALFYRLGREEILLSSNLKELSKILGKDIKLIKNNKSNKVVKLVNNLTIYDMFKIQEKKQNLKYINIVGETHRTYYYPEALCHITGYVGEVGTNELLTPNKYKIGDRVGRGGIEQFYDKYLKGQDGGWQIEVNARGYYIRAFKYIHPKIGANIYTTIDLKLQIEAYNLLKNTVTGKGAVVVIDVRTGAIKALVSCPGFNANNISKNFDEYLKDKKLPLFNRALQALYPPGSIFKIVTLTAALEILNTDHKRTMNCTGSFKLGNRYYSCWCKSGHGDVNLISAMAQSCNIYFYHLGLKIGVKNLKEYAKKFYFGRETHIDLPNEKKGFIPDRKWKEQKMKTPWRQGDTVIFSIGQGALWTTPLQMAYMMSVVANKGKEYNRPYIVEKIKNFDGKEIYKHKKSIGDIIKLSSNTWNVLHEALLEVVENGTGKRSKISDIKIAGKTGTAQNPHGEGHAWFVSYAPADVPEIAMAVIVENGGSGGSSAAPIGKKIYETYFNMKLENKDKNR
ncbi:MAG: penicillin-binding protein 2 [Endomicrobium sp.]|jgi:penicillin-binding protein 2|nr:penicillin-binding protein 2 [Endomicrobium sp.]